MWAAQGGAGAPDTPVARPGLALDSKLQGTQQAIAALLPGQNAALSGCDLAPTWHGSVRGRNRMGGTSYGGQKRQPCSVNRDCSVLIKESTFRPGWEPHAREPGATLGVRPLLLIRELPVSTGRLTTLLPKQWGPRLPPL